MPLETGDPLPALQLADADGARVDLARLRGEHMLMVFLRHLA